MDSSDLPTKIDRRWFIEKLHTRIVEIIGRTWDFWYGLTLRYKDEFNNPNAPGKYRTAEGYSLGSWQNTQSSYYKIGKLSPDRIKRLEDIGFTWERLEEKFEKGFQETLHYKESIGNPNAEFYYKTAEGYPLGIWQVSQRQFYRQGKISPDRIKKLENIGFTWERREEKFEKGFTETLLYKARTGDLNAPNSYKTAEGYYLGSWQSDKRARKGKLSPEQIKRLEEIGFTWEKNFGKGYEETLLYKDRTGNPNVPLNYKTAEGYRLGFWQSIKRHNYKKGNLSQGWIKRLEDIGFTLENYEEKFEKGFTETWLYKKSTDNPNAPQKYKTPEGYSLGTWQATQRVRYKMGKLSQERIKRFEEIGFKWERHEEKFEKGFTETLRYKESIGNPNAPQHYKTVEGYPLGFWQSVQRHNYKKRRLSPDRIKRLEKIGFKWGIQEEFEKGFQETLLYNESTGNPNAPANYKTAEGYRLGFWQSVKRHIYKKGKLSSDRIKRLEEIGFKWRLSD